MKHTVKLARVEGRKQIEECIRFLESNRVCNLYLFEGVATSYPLFRTCGLVADEGIIGVVHTKNGTYLHLSLSPRLDHDTVCSIENQVRKKSSSGSQQSLK